MNGENARANAGQETRRGDEALAAARVLLDAGLYQDSISRAYYAAFHWARGLLVSRGIEARSHRATIQLVGLHFVKDGPLTTETAGLLSQLETFRELCDYNPQARFTREQAAAQIENAARFIETLKPLLAER